jgi:hypothetical protein
MVANDKISINEVDTNLQIGVQLFIVVGNYNTI